MKMTLGQFLSQTFGSPRNLTDFTRVDQKLDNQPISNVEVDLKSGKVLLYLQHSSDAIELPLVDQSKGRPAATRTTGLDGSVGIGG